MSSFECIPHAVRATLVAFVATVALLAAAPARANIAQSRMEGPTYAPIVARVPSALRVDSEDLDFELAADLGTALVTATYRMSNPGAASSVDAAFAYVRGDRRAGDETAPSVSVDGTPVEYTTTSDADQLVGRLLAWIASHPAVEEEIVRLGALDHREFMDLKSLRGLVSATGRGCGSGCESLVGAYAELKKHTNGAVGERLGDVVVDASKELVPEAADQMKGGWSTLTPSSRIQWLVFRLELAEHATRTVVVRYSHVAGVDLASHVNRTFLYHYLLSPAKSWASFGPLHVTVHAPPTALVTSSLPFEKKPSGYEAQLPGLPEGELTLEAMSMRGVWLGMTTPSSYWAILVLAMTASTIFIGTRLGRFASRTRPGCLASILWASATAALCMAAGAVIAGGVGACGPERALGFGYGPALGSVFFMLVSGLAGAILGSVVAKRGRAAARGPLG